jgi:putative ABC transport system permease protein
MTEIRQDELDKIKSIKNAANVAAVGPMVLGPVSLGDHRVLMAGVDFRAAEILRPWWIVNGKIPVEENSAVLGADASKVSGVKAGDRINIQGRELLVTGILEPTDLRTMGRLAPLATARLSFETGQGLDGGSGCSLHRMSYPRDGGQILRYCRAPAHIH